LSLQRQSIQSTHPKWALDVTTVGIRKFNWLAFSSKRNDPMISAVGATVRSQAPRERRRVAMTLGIR
jgi:hypothetical protein